MYGIYTSMGSVPRPRDPNLRRRISGRLADRFADHEDHLEAAAGSALDAGLAGKALAGAGPELRQGLALVLTRRGQGLGSLAHAHQARAAVAGPAGERQSDGGLLVGGVEHALAG